MKVSEPYGDWVVKNPTQVNGKVLCKCACGRVKHVSVYTLKRGTSRRCLSCGAKRQRLCEGRRLLPSLSKEEYYRISTKVNQAIARCTDPTHYNYKDYGGRGVVVCKEWLENPVLFMKHLTTLVGWDDRGLWLDRADNNKGYEPGNLRFVTPSESGMNRRNKTETGKAGAYARWHGEDNL